MPRFRKIAPSIWADEKFNSLSTEAKLTFFYLLTNPNISPIGVLSKNSCILSVEMKKFIKPVTRRFACCLQEIYQRKMAIVDEENIIIWLPNYLKYNPPINPNIVRYWKTSYNEIPECELKKQIGMHIREYLKKYDTRFHDIFVSETTKPNPENLIRGLADKYRIR